MQIILLWTWCERTFTCREWKNHPIPEDRAETNQK